MASFLRRVRRRTWIIVGAALALVLGGTAVYVFGFAIPGAQQGAQAQSFEVTQPASLQTLEKSVTASGTLTPLVNETVDFEGSGTVLTVDVAEGQAVTAGQQLATIDTLTLNAELLDAKATLASAQARLADSKSGSSGSTADKAQVAADAAAVEVAQAGVASAQAALDGATLLAPVTGTITSIGVEVGDTVGSTGNGNGANGDTTASAFTIVGTDSWRVDATVGEADVALIAAGDAVHLTTDDGTVLEGTVSEVGMLPSTDSGAAEYPVTIAVDGTAEGLFDGVAVDVEIVYESRDEVLTVPSAAVTTADGASTVTLIGADGTRTTTPVEVGETVGDLTEILSGLAEGDEVLVAAFTPGEGNDGQIRQLPGGGTFTPPDGAMPGGTIPGGGTFTQGGPAQQGANG